MSGLPSLSLLPLTDANVYVLSRTAEEMELSSAVSRRVPCIFHLCLVEGKQRTSCVFHVTQNAPILAHQLAMLAWAPQLSV